MTISLKSARIKTDQSHPPTYGREDKHKSPEIEVKVDHRLMAEDLITDH